MIPHIRLYDARLYCDNCGKGYSTQGSIKTLWLHLDRFAFELDVIQKMYSGYYYRTDTALTETLHG